MPATNFWSRNTSKAAQREIARTALAMGVDARALHILYNTFFNEDDKLLPWVEKRDVPAQDFAFAKAAGLMFDPLRLNHDELIAWVLAARDALTPLDVANAFMASFGSRRLDIRSALGSYAHVLHLEAHAFEPDEEGDCAVCGVPKKANKIDLSARNFRRIKWAGNVEHGSLDYIGCDLSQFAKGGPVSPTEDDIETMRRLLQAIRDLPESAQLTDLYQAIAGLFPSNKHERQVVLEILGYAGILQPKAWPSYFEAWVRPDETAQPSHFYKKEWCFPASGWTGRDGVNEAAVRFWFPQAGAVNS